MPDLRPTRHEQPATGQLSWLDPIRSYPPFTRTPTILPSCLVFHGQLVTFSFFIFRPLLDPSGKWPSFSPTILNERVLNLGLRIFLSLSPDNPIVFTTRIMGY